MSVCSSWSLQSKILAPLWLLMLVILGSLFWVQEMQADAPRRATGEQSPDAAHDSVSAFQIAFERQKRMTQASQKSRTAWPLPQEWKPKVNVAALVDRAFGGAPAEPPSGDAAEALAEPKPTGRNLWLYCAGQYEECACYGKIRWGNSGQWQTLDPPSADVSNRVMCQVGKQVGYPALKDVRPGDDRKHCECQVNTATLFFDSINIQALPKEERSLITGRDHSTCQSFQEDQSLQGQHLWEGIEGICDSEWHALRHEKAGPKALSHGLMARLMRTGIDGRFMKNYKKFFKNGWMHRGFVSFFSGSLEGPQSQTMEALIDSVHRFSVYPIVVLHAGLATPIHWRAEVYPRLVLLSMYDMPSELGYSMTILIAAIASRVKNGLVLTYNSLVIPGVDAIFSHTEAEINREYPYPLMPVHFLDRKPSDGGSMWEHFCQDDDCKLQTMRWNQMGLSWTHWALPLLGKTLRQLFRDETFFGKPGYKDLPIRALPDAEALLNVALWEAGATKQWCKIDMPDPSEVEAWLEIKGRGPNCDGSAVCAHLAGDRRFYKKGIPKVYAFLRYSSEPSRSIKIINRISRRLKEGTLLPPIIFDNRLIQNSEELKELAPDLKCLAGI